PRATPGDPFPGTRVLAITDGTSNTLLVGELAGRPMAYRAGRQVAPFAPFQGAGWADALNGENWFIGSLFDGTEPSNGGPCVINCTNSRARVLCSSPTLVATGPLADGPVRSVSSSLNQCTFAYLVTKKKGDLVPNY